MIQHKAAFFALKCPGQGVLPKAIPKLVFTLESQSIARIFEGISNTSIELNKAGVWTPAAE